MKLLKRQLTLVLHDRLDPSHLEMHCHEASPQNPPNYFLLEGHIDGAVEAAVTRLHELAEHCRSAKLEFSIDYEEVDAAGNPLSEERTIN
ncbi:hypothetical protein ACW2Q0_30355 [Nocardia sp. R16R-3T]